MSDYHQHPEEFPDTITLADGDEVEIPRPDNVFPTLSAFEASVDVYIEDGRIRIREEEDCKLSVGVANNSIDPDQGLATLLASISDGRDGRDEIYAEIALDSPEQIRELRDALTLALRYRGCEDAGE